MAAVAATPAAPATDERPIRGETFSVEQLEERARELARSHRLSTMPPDGRRFLQRFEDNCERLTHAFCAITEAARSGEPITPDAEWLIDNFYVVEEQLREIRDDLPYRYFLELPALSNGAEEGTPRVYALAMALILHTDSGIDEDAISRIVAAYQEVTPLTMGELWAVPIMIRLVLVENLRRLACDVLEAREQRIRADELYERWHSEGESLLGHVHREHGLPLILRLVERLREGGSECLAFIHEVERRLSAEGTGLDECTRQDWQRQASNQVSIGNVITSMRLVTMLDWMLFFERVSLVEKVLRRDPAGVYAAMDTATRDRYRHVIERLARRTDLSELSVAESLIRQASYALQHEAPERERHVGYYLLEPGRLAFERVLGYRPTVSERISRGLLRFAVPLYLVGIATITVLLAACVSFCARAAGGAWPAGLAIGLLALLPASELTVLFVNYLVTLARAPQLLPKLEFKERIPCEAKTIIVMPTLFVDELGIDTLINRIESHYLANQQPSITFALLADFTDAPKREMPTDSKLVEHAVTCIRTLNERYAKEEEPRFYLLLRARQWNSCEQVWMGWERKRGKLMELNRLLRGEAQTGFVVQEPAPLTPREYKYVITLDSDTQLPHDTARKLIGAISHPLNRPRLAADGEHLDAGYAVLQPRVTVSLNSAERSTYAWIFAQGPGLDPYTAAVSDVYQDLFSEGSFIGKGIYDIEAFDSMIADAFPENAILSHDLIEGSHARVAFVSDIEVVDDQPARYDVDARRLHRWARGDWQLLPWLWRRVPTGAGRRANRLSALSRWKVFDNIRRTLVPPALVLWFVCAALWFPGPAWVWLTFGLSVLFLPVVLYVVNVIRGLFNPSPVHAVHRRRIELARILLQCGLTFSFLPDRAYLMVDAMARSLYRMTCSRHRLLEWETAAATERRMQTSRYGWYRRMWFPAFLACLLAGLLALRPNATLVILALAWGIAPFIAGQVSRRRRLEAVTLDGAQRRELRHAARKMWSFFETFVGPDGHWLPPDNVQEHPTQRVAHRMSPTNEGLFVLSVLTARDFGFVGAHDMLDLLERNMAQLQRLDRHHGHLFNWYATDTLQPLFPRYISTVDSGNLVACFLTASITLRELENQTLLGPRQFDGLCDTLAVVQEAAEQIIGQPGESGQALLAELLSLRLLLDSRRKHVSHSVNWWDRLLEELKPRVERLNQQMRGYAASSAASDVLRLKVEMLQRHHAGLARDCAQYMRWGGLFEPQEGSHAQDERLKPRSGRWHQAGPSVARALEGVLEKLQQAHSMGAISELEESTRPALNELQRLVQENLSHPDSDQALTWIDELTAAIHVSIQSAEAFLRRTHALAEEFERWAKETDFRILYDSHRRLFSVGLNFEDGHLDRAHYDLLASEARVASLLAIAKGDVDSLHWFQLGRALTRVSQRIALVSWGGTMFEYLMPSLFLRGYLGSLLEASCRAAVERQIEFAGQNRIPWGVSESAYGAQASNLDYHYKSFGVPGLGLKRGLARDLVVAPYATALAASFEPAGAVANFRHLAQEGADGPWGFYDALDYTPERVPRGQRNVVVRCYMTHHHGMSLLGLANCLFENCVQRRFHAHPFARAVDLLLQERIPDVALMVHLPATTDTAISPVVQEPRESVSRHIFTPDTPTPRAHFLSNGQHTVMVTSAGGGSSNFRQQAISRFQPDSTLDNWGQFIYLRDVRTKQVWSAGLQPTLRASDEYEAVFSIDKAEIRRRDGDLETLLEITVSPEDNAEVRRITVHNHGWQRAEIELTSYLELVLAPRNADLAHPAFSKMFVQTEYWSDRHALLATRRPRDAGEATLWAVHVLADGDARTIQYETDRARFIGRGRNASNPWAIEGGRSLSGTTGSVLDPIFSLRCRFQVEPNESATAAFTTAVGATRHDVRALADKYHDSRLVQRTFELAWAHAQVAWRHRGLSPGEMYQFQRLASALVFPDRQRRSPAAILSNQQNQASLWSFGISGDLPIVVLRIAEPEHQSLLQELIRAHQYWDALGLDTDLVIIDDHLPSYNDQGHHDVIDLVREASYQRPARPGGIHLFRGAQTPEVAKNMLEALALVVLKGTNGSLARQLQSTSRTAADRARSGQQRIAPSTPIARAARDGAVIEGLECRSPLGGFAQGKEYVIRLKSDQSTPMPWSNVLANPSFGCCVTESGLGSTWAGNSRENRLTPWSNDPVSDPPAEAIYVRDEMTGEVSTPTPLPIREASDYLIRHGQGYSKYEHTSGDVAQELLVSISHDQPVKFLCLSLHNRGTQTLRLSVTYYVDWVLGVTRTQVQPFIRTSADPARQAILATNPYQLGSAGKVAFMRALDRPCTVTGDRTEFFGRNGSWRQPAALNRPELSGRTGAGLDPCGALRTNVALKPGEREEVIFVLGQAASDAELEGLFTRYDNAEDVHAAIEETIRLWRNVQAPLQVRTPDRALDLLMNGWLLYQVLACRVWGRTAFYQSGGAYGFRDQLQDVMALVYSRPDLAREHVLRAASRQYEEGDVQHWWHESADRGIRTRYSDDPLWLAFVTAHYVRTTGDHDILQEHVPYLHSAVLRADENERYEQAEVSPQADDLYGHCVRAIDHSWRLGPHGLPLMGTGDWNDGMNRVGAQGRGESVWLAWFMVVVLEQFAWVAESRNDHARATQYFQRAGALRNAVEEHAWDGAWYRRAYFDDGTPLGSAQNDECRIDLLPQAWAVIAGGRSDRARQALSSAVNRLVREQSNLILLLEPPFDRGAMDPGYIKHYPPGIRENGGQYTHAATWLVMAHALEGEGDMAVKLLSMLNPIRRDDSMAAMQRYQVEPYVVAADIYSAPNHVGRGGWTWYTGSAAWMYRVTLECILGFKLRGDRLLVEPCIASEWPGFEITYQFRGSSYRLVVENPRGVQRGVVSVTLDSHELETHEIPLVDDGRSHEIRVTMGRAVDASERNATTASNIS